MTIRKGVRIASVLLISLALFAIPAYQPLKFRYAIWRLESATTLEAERAACTFASQVGRVWEVNEIHKKFFWTLPERINPGTNEMVTEIEWREGPWWTMIGSPYRAYRVMLAPKSRNLLVSGTK